MAKKWLKLAFIVVVFVSLVYLCLIRFEDSETSKKSGKYAFYATFNKSLITNRLPRLFGSKREISAVLERGLRKHRVRILLRPETLRGEQLPREELLRYQQQVKFLTTVQKCGKRIEVE